MLTLIDGHVHLYDNQEVRTLLDGAAGSFRAQGREAGIHSAWWAGCLALVDPSGVDGFGRLGREDVPGWTLERVGDCAFEATRESDDTAMLIIGGRQLRTEAGLEVLAYGLRHPLTDGGSLSDQANKVLKLGAVPVVPWGFGKWLGRRGSEVEGLLRTSLGDRIVLADSFTRPALWKEPAAFRVARAHGVPIVAGTDPLPFPGQEGKAGRYGFLLDLQEGEVTLGEALNSRLRSREGSPRLYGRREGAWSALRLQIAMQLRRRSRDGGTGDIRPRGVGGGNEVL
ncbi:MAG: hypothetical protein OEO23_03975 [Gemmatimonadota bacterium]|nr:hypothetical protein [Gemmatimonadota bacterium]